MHPSTKNILSFFSYEHLPAPLGLVVIPFASLARSIADNLEGPEVTACLRKLLEAKDCAVRAAIESLPQPEKFGFPNPGAE